MISIVVTYLPVDDESIDELTTECIDRINKYTSNVFELIVVSNGFTTKTWGEDILLLNRKNLGNAKAWDQGISIASADTVFLMDNDVFVEPDWDIEMTNKLKRPDIGVTFPYSILGTEDYRATDYRGRRDGFCFALTKSTYAQVGPFLQDQPFHSYFEDDNFFMGVQNLRLNLFACPSSRVWHKGQGTTKIVNNKEIEEGKENNKKWFETKWHGEYPSLTK